MQYNEYLASILDDTYCPFCSLSKQEIIEESKHFLVIPARAPYSKDHLLIIPKRHIVLLQEMRSTEMKELLKLIEYWSDSLASHHEGTSILLRNGQINGTLGKSVNHLHVHLIPDCQVGVENSEFRHYFSNARYIKEVRRIRSEFLH
ncbi:MAG: HIT family protein [Candidatus Peribacteria bacterium]|nr:HIT family protein [Candidatus Peribacteria bacterium]